MILNILMILGIVLFDQAVKYFAVHVLTQHTIVVLPGVFELTYVENRGAAFSFLENHILFFVVITCVVLAIIVYALYKKLVKTKIGCIALLFVAGGALGNLVDRLVHRYVVDIFYFRLINFPVFNIADVFIVCGGILFIYYVLVQHDKVSGKE